VKTRVSSKTFKYYCQWMSLMLKQSSVLKSWKNRFLNQLILVNNQQKYLKCSGCVSKSSKIMIRMRNTQTESFCSQMKKTLAKEIDKKQLYADKKLEILEKQALILICSQCLNPPLSEQHLM